MKYVIIDVLGNFGEYKGILIPTTGRDEDTKEIAERIVRERYQDTILVMKIIADVVYRKERSLNEPIERDP